MNVLKSLIRATISSLPRSSLSWLESEVRFDISSQTEEDAIGNVKPVLSTTQTWKARLRKPASKIAPTIGLGREEQTIEFIGYILPDQLPFTIAIGSRGTATINGEFWHIRLLATAQSNLSEMREALGSRVRIEAYKQGRAL